jgi:hypothetical protein
MAGIRIHHPTLADCTLIVRHPGGGQRKAKDYHIHLDSEGDTIVSETVWQRLQEAKGSGQSPHAFIVLNEVPDPPDLVVGDPSATREVRTFVQTPDGVEDAELLSIAQSFAPRGVTPRISPSR